MVVIELGCRPVLAYICVIVVKDFDEDDNAWTWFLWQQFINFIILG